MVDITHGGLGFKWSALDRRSKWLAGLSLLTAVMGAAPFGFAMGALNNSGGYRLGYWMANGEWPTRPPESSLFTPELAWLVVALLTASAVLWWRFSVRQDELFNRVQNWALGMGGAWTAAVLAGWAILSLSGAVPPVTPLPLIGTFCGCVGLFWIYAVRRWVA